ncbi:MAG: O-antigen ligase family protein [Patescibacteria group bacterium]
MSSELRLRVIRVLAVVLATSPIWYIPITLFPTVSGKLPIALVLIAVVGVLASITPAASTRAARPLVIAVGIFVMVSALAAAFGVDWEQSIWGSAARGTGLVTIAACVVWFLSAQRLLTARDWRLFWWAAVAAAVVEAFVVIVEAAVPAVRAIFHEQGRYSGLIGNPASLAGYLTMSMAVLVLLASAAKRRGRAVLAVAATAIVTALFLTGTRSGIVGLAAAAAVGIAVIFFSGRRAHRLAMAVGLGVAVVLLTAAFVAPWGALEQIGVPSGFGRVLNWRAYVNDPTRILEWKIALASFQARPLLGWGPENFQAAFDRHYDPALLRYSFSETVSDKPHNIFLEMLVAGGVPLLLAYLGLFAAAAWGIVRLRRQGSMTVVEAAAAGAMLVAYAVHGLFLFETYPTGLLFFSLLAFVAARMRSSSATEMMRPPFVFRIAAGGFAVVALIAGLMTVPASMSALHAIEADTPTIWTKNARFAFDAWSVRHREVVKMLARDFINRAVKNDETLPFFRDNVRIMRQQLEKEARWHPGDFTVQFMLGQVLAMEGELYASPDALQQSLAAMERADVISPRRQAVKFQLAKTLLLGGKSAEAVNVMRSVVAEDETLQEPHWFLALALTAAGDRVAGADELARALALGRLGKMRDEKNVQELLYVIEIYDEEKRYADIVPLYETLFDIDPKNAQWHANLAATYEKLGKPELAALEAQRAVEIDPTLREAADQFINRLKSIP